MSSELPDLIVTPARRRAAEETNAFSQTQAQGKAPEDKQQHMVSHNNLEQKRGVTFDMSQNKVHEIRHYKDLSPEETAATWFTIDEMLASKQVLSAIVMKMMKSKGEPLEETDELTCRGLEFKTRDGSKQRKKNKRRAYTAVLQEQEIQQEEEVNEPELIAEVYREVAAPLALEALNRGWKDQKIMLDFLEPDVRMEREQRLSTTAKSKNMMTPIMTNQRRRSLTETLSANDMQAHRGAI